MGEWLGQWWRSGVGGGVSKTTLLLCGLGGVLLPLPCHPLVLVRGLGVWVREHESVGPAWRLWVESQHCSGCQHVELR